MLKGSRALSQRSRPVGGSSIFDWKSETVRRPTGPGSGGESRRAVSCSMGRAERGGRSLWIVNIAMIDRKE
jgi:hypothetical protein